MVRVSRRPRRIALATLFAFGIFILFIAPVRATHGTQTLTQIAGPTIETFWDAAFDQDGGDRLRGAVLSADGTRLFLTGRDSDDFMTIAVNTTTGAQVWRSFFDGPFADPDGDEAQSIATNTDSSVVFVAGRVGRNVGGDDIPTFAVVAYNAGTGAQVWATVNTSLFTATSGDIPTQMCFSPDPDGGGAQIALVIVTGVSVNTPLPGRSFYATVAYNATTGAVVWSERFATHPTATFDPESEKIIPTATAIACDSQRVYVTGIDLNAAGTNFDANTRALNRNTGAALWNHPHSGAAGDLDGALDIGLSADGTAVLVCGVMDLDLGTGDPLPLLFSVSAATGTLNWELDFPNIVNANWFGLTVGSADEGVVGAGAPGRIYVAGEGHTVAPDIGGYLVAGVDPDGTLVWGPTVYDGGSSGNVGDTTSARSIVATRAPGGFTGEWVYVTGIETTATMDSDLTTIGIVGFQPAGAPDPVEEADLLWDARFDGPVSADDGDLKFFDDDTSVAFDFFDDVPQDQLIAAAADGNTIYAVGTVTDGSTSYNASAYRYAPVVPPTVVLVAPTGTEPVLVKDTEQVGELGTQVTATAAPGTNPLAGGGATIELLLDGEVVATLPFDTGSTYQDFVRFIRDNTQPFDCSNEGLHTLAARAFDTQGNFGADSLLVNIDNTTFPDVACTDGAFLFVEALVRAGIAAGFPDGTYRPTNTVNRGAMAVFMSRAADRILGTFAAFTPPACGSETFSDVDCNHASYKFIEYVAANGIAGGFPDGTYKPGNVVTRSAMAVFLARVRDLADGDLAAFAPPACGSETFPDVDCTHPSYKFIEYIVSKGIAGGFPDGTYKPANAVTRGQMAVFITRTANLVF